MFILLNNVILNSVFFKEIIIFVRNWNLENSFYNFLLKWIVYIDKSIKIDFDLKEVDNDKL